MIAVVIAVHRLPEQRHLAGAEGGEALDLAHDVGQPAAPLGAARVGHDAKGAAVVATALHRDERRGTVFPHRRDVLVMLPGTEGRVRGPLALHREADEVRQVPIGVRSHDEVDPRHALQQRRAESLRHAANHAQDVPGPLVSLQLTHPANDPLFGVVAHRAGVDQHDVGLGGILRADVALAAKDPEHELGVRHVHLAPVGLDVDPLHGLQRYLARAGPSP